MTFHHGVQTIELLDGPRPITTIATAVIGLVATAEDADPLTFPLDHAVCLTDLDEALGKAGNTGTLAPALSAIRDQARTIVIVVRVAASAVEATQTASTVGTVKPDGTRTGLQALLDAESLFGFKPRILGAPGLDNQAVTAAMVTLAERMKAYVYAKAIGADIPLAIGYRSNFGARELTLITPDVKTLRADGEIVVTSSIARAMGLRAKIDQEIGWHKTLSNVEINGVLGIERPISFDLQDMNNDAGMLGGADLTTIIRRDGYRFWGNRTCSDDPQYAFENFTRSNHVVRDTIAEGLFWAIDKPLTPGLVTDIVSSINYKFSQMVRDGYLLGGECWFDPMRNPKDQLNAGRLDLDYDFGPVPPLEALWLRQRITDRYLSDFSTLRAA